MLTPFLMWQFPSGSLFKASHSKVRNTNAVCVREGDGTLRRSSKVTAAFQNRWEVRRPSTGDAEDDPELL